ncbi:hypothetical protein BJ322DRAFT_561822 [Thelephora terrestris]|uniref:Uncharacterized protein n=1 Tax=Thelephora terrestris TaxID=56493 RepID=A0A9P6LAT5_9AGAM|nr:hypothetical protein BJ322DRAFT_561822 [Thelephora terrestris]
MCAGGLNDEHVVFPSSCSGWAVLFGRADFGGEGEPDERDPPKGLLRLEVEGRIVLHCRGAFRTSLEFRGLCRQHPMMLYLCDQRSAHQYNGGVIHRGGGGKGGYGGCFFWFRFLFFLLSVVRADPSGGMSTKKLRYWGEGCAKKFFSAYHKHPDRLLRPRARNHGMARAMTHERCKISPAFSPSDRDFKPVDLLSSRSCRLDHNLSFHAHLLGQMLVSPPRPSPLKLSPVSFVLQGLGKGEIREGSR